jgi:hypothetical protein
MKLTLITSALFLFLISGLVSAASGDESKTKGDLPSFVDADGTIHFPGKIRGEWAHLGSWGTADINATEQAHHDVYTQHETIPAFQKTGKFPDGSVLIKELRKVEHGNMTTGHVTWAGDEILWFVLIKDSQNRFEGNENWGEGWGWALFNAGDTGKNASTNYQKDCLGCLVPARSTDWIYLKGYPALRGVHESPTQ